MQMQHQKPGDSQGPGLRAHIHAPSSASGSTCKPRPFCVPLGLTPSFTCQRSSLCYGTHRRRKQRALAQTRLGQRPHSHFSWTALAWPLTAITRKLLQGAAQSYMQRRSQGSHLEARIMPSFASSRALAQPGEASERGQPCLHSTVQHQCAAWAPARQGGGRKRLVTGSTHLDFPSCTG